MSYTTVAYGVDLERLAAVQGSRDGSLIAAIEREFADRLAQADKLNSQFGQFPIDLRTALRRIVDNDLRDTSDGACAQYIYACELLCAHLGHALDGREHIKFLEDLDWRTTALEPRPPLRLPPFGPLPAVSHLTAMEVQAEYERFKDYDGDEDEAWLADAREEFVWWLKQCADANLGLVLFCY